MLVCAEVADVASDDGGDDVGREADHGGAEVAVVFKEP